MGTMTKFDQQVEALQQWFDSPRFARVLRLYSARQVAAQRGGIAVDYTVAREAAAAFHARLRELFAERKSITTFGPYSPGQAVTMRRLGIEGIYLGGWATSAKGSVTEDPGSDLALLDPHPMDRVAVAQDQRAARPLARERGRELDPALDSAHAEQLLDRQSIAPRGRAGVPSPAAAADVGRRRVDVGGDDIRLDPIALDRLGARAVREWAEHAGQGPRALELAELGEGPRHPRRRVRVLTAVLAHARRIALDVADPGLGGPELEGSFVAPTC